MAELKAKEIVNQLWCAYMQTMCSLIHDKSSDDQEQEKILNFQEWYSQRPEILLKEFQSLADTLRLLLLIDEENKFVSKSDRLDVESVKTPSVNSDEKSYITDTASHDEENEVGSQSEHDSLSISDSETECESVDEELEDQYYIPLQSILHKILPMTNMLSYNDCESFRNILDLYFKESLEKEWI
jgi:hypothetical protein